MKPSLLLLSGLLCDETIWSDIPKRLKDVATVSVVSFRGFNSLKAMAEHALAHAPAHFAVAGHSMGGRVALEVIRAAAERVTGLGLLNTSVQAVRDGEPQSRGLLLKLAREHGMTALASEWLPPMLAPNAARRSEVLPRLKAMIEHWSADDYEGQVYAMLNRPDAWSALAAVKVPTLLLSGSDDAWSPVSQHEAIRRHIPHATLFEVHDAGHMAPVERPDAVALAIRQWLAALPSQ
jgi:pimeloyl-ACP methyl ester carboxylesterase